jgi:group I intron endonuclease
MGNVSIYLISNKVSGKQYIGQTINTPEERWKQHLKKAKKNPLVGCRALWSAIAKHGKTAFSLSALVVCERDVADDYEKMFIDIYGTKVPHGYNILDGGCIRMTKDTRRRVCEEKPRTRGCNLPYQIHEHRVSKNVGYIVRCDGKYVKCFMSMKYTMEEKLQAAKDCLAGLENDVYTDNSRDRKLPKHVQRYKSHGYIVQVYYNARASSHTKRFNDPTKTKEQLLEEATAYAKIFQKPIPETLE